MGSSFLRRLKFYGIGFGIGLIFVFIFFQNRGCSWLPGNRVKNTILERVMIISDDTAKEFKSKGLTKKDAIAALNSGDVEFGESDKNNDSKVYVVEHEGRKFLYTLPYESFISEVKLGGDANKTKTTDTGMGTMWRFPLDDHLVYFDSTDLLQCQLDQLNIKDSKALFSTIKKTGKIDLERTNLAHRPKPEHYIVFYEDTTRVVAKAIWYKDKIEILSLEFQSDVKCP